MGIHTTCLNLIKHQKMHHRCGIIPTATFHPMLYEMTLYNTSNSFSISKPTIPMCYIFIWFVFLILSKSSVIPMVQYGYLPDTVRFGLFFIYLFNFFVYFAYIPVHAKYVGWQVLNMSICIVCHSDRLQTQKTLMTESNNFA